MEGFIIMIGLVIVAIGIPWAIKAAKNLGEAGDHSESLKKMKGDLRDLYSLKPIEEREREFSLKQDELQSECYKQFRDTYNSKHSEEDRERLLSEISEHFYLVEKGLRTIFFGEEENSKLGFSTSARDKGMSHFLIALYHFDEAFEALSKLKNDLEPPLKLSEMKTFSVRADYISERGKRMEDLLATTEGI